MKDERARLANPVRGCGQAGRRVRGPAGLRSPSTAVAAICASQRSRYRAAAGGDPPPADWSGASHGTAGEFVSPFPRVAPDAPTTTFLPKAAAQTAPRSFASAKGPLRGATWKLILTGVETTFTRRHARGGHC